MIMDTPKIKPDPLKFKDKQKYYADCVRKNLEPNE